MYTQTMEQKGALLVVLENGPTVKLLEQTQDHQAVFVGPGKKDEPVAMPAALFFQTHRQATPDEIEDYERHAPAKDDVENRVLELADNAQSSANQAKLAAGNAHKSADAASTSEKAADKSAGRAESAATKAEAAATKAATPPPSGRT
jgi:hypothetical protein